MGRVSPVALIEIARRFGFRQAIEAAKVTPVGQAHPQIAQDSTLGVNKLPDGAHLAGVLVAAGALVGETIFTLPSEPTSTFRS